MSSHRPQQIFARLKPQIDPNETLLEGYTERPTIDIPIGSGVGGEDNNNNNECCVVTLGRGRRTGIAEKTLGRRVLEIMQSYVTDEFGIETEPALQVTPLVSFDKARIHINGNPLLVSPGENIQIFDGDILSLHNLRYEYRVVILNNNNNDENNNASSSSSVEEIHASNPRRGAIQYAFQQMASQIAAAAPPSDGGRSSSPPSFRDVSLAAARPGVLCLWDDSEDDEVRLASSSSDTECNDGDDAIRRRSKRNRQSSAPASAAPAARQPSPINMSPLTDPGHDNNDKKSDNDDDDDDDQKKPAAVTTTAAAAAATTTKPAAAAATKTSFNADDLGGIIVSSEHKTKLSEEIQCCVCLDIQIQPRTLNPCGHTFCLGCVKKLDSCPECREAIESHAAARMLDNLISTLVGIPCLFEDDDVEQYKIRRKTAEEEAKKIPVKRSRRSKRRRMIGVPPSSSFSSSFRHLPTASSASRNLPQFELMDNSLDGAIGSLLPLAAAAGASAATATIDNWSSRRRHHRAAAAAGPPPHPPPPHSHSYFGLAAPHHARAARHAAVARNNRSMPAHMSTRRPSSSLSPAASAAATTVFHPPPPGPAAAQLRTAPASSSARAPSSFAEGRSQADAICID